MQSSPLRALSHYRLLPTVIPVADLAISAAARIPYAMLPLGTVSAVSLSTQSFPTGGSATATIALASALASPFIGRLCDSRGLVFLLRIFWPLSVGATALLLTAVIQGWSDWRLFVAAALSGCTMIPVGALTRARWVCHTTEPRLLSTAFSFETMTDELMFVIGPIFVGIASIFTPSGPIITALALIVLALGAMTLRSSHQERCSTDHTADVTNTQQLAPIIAEPQSLRPSIVRILWSVIPCIVILTCMGIIFGVTQTALSHRAHAAGVGHMAGLWYASMGIGSAIISILAVLIPSRISMSMRIAWGALLLSATMTACSLTLSLPLTGLMLFISGFGMGLILVSSFAAAEYLSPHGGIGVAMTAMPASITIGVSLGSVGGGHATLWGSGRAFTLCIAAGLCALFASLWLRIRYVHRESSMNVPRLNSR